MVATPLKVEIIKTEIIKPSSPTPHDLKHLKLSLLDQLAAAAYTPLVLFYPMNGDSDTNNHVKATERSHRLKISLSETLTRFYPLAGRARDNTSIDCNDDGVDFIEARVNCLLSNILQQPNVEVLKKFLPIEIESNEAATGRMLLVQATFFECGGMAIGVSMSHKVADASSMSSFIKSWSTIALGCSSELEVLPKFIGTSLLPPMDFPINMPAADLASKKCVTRRFMFDASKIASLKARAASTIVQHPTRVEAVTGIIWKCARIASRSTSGIPKASVMSQTVNLRRRFVPPLAESSIGNLLGHFTAQTVEEEKDLQDLVGLLREGIREFSENGVRKYQGDDALLKIFEYLKESGSLYKRDDIDFYICSSWSKFQLYESDFGWGKPIWVSIASLGFSNFVVLMDTRDGEGIEAWVTLSEEDMALFESDQELLSFASLNPSAF